MTLETPTRARPEAALYALLAEFETPEELVDAASRARAAGYGHVEAYTPFPVHDLPEAMGFRDWRLPWIIFAGGVAGAFTGFALQWYISAVDYPLNIGGRPYLSWPAFIPVTFELTVLFAAAAAVIGMLALNGLPQPYHPIFNAPGFDRATSDRFFLSIEADDPRFDPEETRRFLLGLEPVRVTEATV